MTEQMPHADAPRGRIDLSRPFYGFAACVASALVTILFSEYLFDNTLTLFYRTILAGLAAALALVGLMYAAARRFPGRLAVSRVLEGLWMVILPAAAINIAFGLIPLQGYGDKVPMIMFVESAYTFPRWLMGTALLKWFHAGVWEMGTVQRLLPARLLTAQGYVEITGSVLMCIATLVILHRRPGRLSVAFATLVPNWFLFSTGYVEYYAYIAWFFLFLLLYLFETDGAPGNRSPWEVGILIAALPVIYVAFAPLSFFLLVFYALERPREIWRTIPIAIIAAIVMVRVFYPDDIDVFFENLYLNMQFPDRDTYGEYIGHAASKGSNFFSIGFALSWKHLLQLFYMYLWGGGIVFPAVLAGAFIYTRRHARTDLAAAVRTRKFWLAAVLLSWHLYYMLFYIPRLGPKDDIDLFFPTFVIIAYFAGYLLDRLIEEGRLSEQFAPGLTALLLGGTAVAVTYLLFLGLPIVP